MGRRNAAARRTPLPAGLVLPAAALIALALGYPLVRQVVLSLQEFGLAQQFGRPPEWVGLGNYRELVGDSYLWTVAGASWLAYFRALKIGDAARVAPIDKLSIVLVAIFGVVFLGEKLNVMNWLGVSLIAGGALLLALF